MNNAYQKWLAGEGCCNAHNFINIETPDCDKHDVCDCENILLEISKLHTDDEILQEEIDAISGETLDAYTKQETDALLDEKLDASAYTPVDLSDYYTKEQVDELIPTVPSLSGYATQDWVEQQGYLTTVEPLKTINGESLIGEGNIVVSGGSIDAYTKTEADNRFQPIGDYLSENALSGYATQDWVLNKHYITVSELTQYITNLQQQINSLIAEVSGCCGSSGETQYRWITETGENDYWCSGTTKMSKEKQQSSTDGINWVDTGVERSGSTVLEENCETCGYVPSYGMKLTSHYNNGNTKIINCNGEWTDTFIDGRDYRDYETGASGLTSAEIGSCPTAIAGYGFSGCTNLTAVTIPNNVIHIGAWSFLGCISLESITLPSGTTSINQSAFGGCRNLTNVTCLATTPPNMGDEAFPHNANLVIYVPSASVNAYKTARYWNNYSSNIQGI